MKKICFVVYDLSILGGAEQVAVNIANALCKQYKINFFSICKTKGEIPYTLDEGISVNYGVQGNARIRVLIKKVHNTFVRHVNANAFDVVISVGAYPGGIISLSRFFTKAKTPEPVAVSAPIVTETPERPAAPGSAGQVKLHGVAPKTAAMLMAIVADKMGKPLNELRFISIKEVE